MIDLLVTSIVEGGPESVGRMIDCIFGFTTVQFVVCMPGPLINYVLILLPRASTPLSCWSLFVSLYGTWMRARTSQLCHRLSAQFTCRGQIILERPPVHPTNQKATPRLETSYETFFYYISPTFTV